jgi:DNA replication and repair protein RecF
VYVRHLQVTDFRSWPQADLALEPGVTVLIGPNGVGKTNLVEAFGYLATLGSHRVATDAPLVRSGASRAIVRGAVVNAGRELLVELEIAPGKANRARINRAAVTRPREVLGILRTVLFAPEDLTLVRGDPGERRRFLDELLVARSPRYAGVRAEYERVLRQRSALLKSVAAARKGLEDPHTLEVWDGHLAEAGATLLAGRLDLTADLVPHVASGYAEVSGDLREDGARRASIRYSSSLGDSLPEGYAQPGGPRADIATLRDAMLTELRRVRKQEIERGFSLVGPHRDDLDLVLGELPAKGYASHGETWSFALALRVASYRMLTADGAEPVLLLDDVFAELDERRRARLATLVAAAEQVVVTAAVAEDVPAGLSGTRFDVRGDEMQRVE